MNINPQMFDIILLVFSLTGCLGLITAINDLFHKIIGRNKAIKLILSSLILIICGEFYSGFLRFIYLHPFVRFFFIY